MYPWVDVWVGRWMDEYMAEGRAWGSQLSPLGSSFDTYIHHCCCSPLPQSLGPISSAHSTAGSPERWWNGLGECVMRVTGAHRSQTGSSSSGSRSQQHRMKAARLVSQTCHTSTCFTGPTFRVLTKGAPNHLHSLSQLEHSVRHIVYVR